VINVFKDTLLGEPELVVLVYSKFKKWMGRTKWRMSYKQSFFGLCVLDTTGKLRPIYLCCCEQMN